MPIHFFPHLFFASLLLVLAPSPAASSSSLPPPSSSNSIPSPTTTLLIPLLSAAIFFLVVFVVYILRCLGVPINPAGMSPHSVPAAPKGVTPDLLRSFPTFVYSEVKEHKVGKGDLECAICITEFKDYEMLRLLPKCDHVFHLECIDEWVSGHVTCPVCRADLVHPSGDSSVSGGAADSVQEARSHVEVEIREPNSRMDASMMREKGKEGGGAGVVLNMRKKWWCRLGRSHSTGHLRVHPGDDDNERFTLRLPGGVREQITERPPVTPYFFTCDCEEDVVSVGRYKTGEGSV